MKQCVFSWVSVVLRGRAYDPLKRGLDVVVSMLGLVLLSPVMGATALLVRRNLGSPAIFKQERPGRGGKIFTLYKFRSMLDVDLERGLVEDADRLPPFGKLLRSSSLDELPSLVNVLKGEMSLVGPRPLLVEYLELYTPEQARRHEVRPGITGLAQVSGRNELAWEHKFDMDVEYVNSRSLALDLRIVLFTLRVLVTREGITESGYATSSRFEAEQ